MQQGKEGKETILVCFSSSKVGVYLINVKERAKVWLCFFYSRIDLITWNIRGRIQVHLRSLFLASLAGAGFLLGTEIFNDFLFLTV